MLMNADWLTLFSLAKRPWKKKPSKTAHFQSVSTLLQPNTAKNMWLHDQASKGCGESWDFPSHQAVLMVPTPDGSGVSENDE